MTGVTLYDKEGKPTYFRFTVDAAEARKYGEYTDQPPQGKEEQPEKTDEDLQKEVDVSERVRAGLPLTPEERPQVVETPYPDLRRDAAGETYVVGGSVTGESPAGPVSREVVDTFNPALADRSALFGWLRANEVEVANAAGTDTLREKVFEKMQEQKAISPRGKTATKGEQSEEK